MRRSEKERKAALQARAKSERAWRKVLRTAHRSGDASNAARALAMIDRLTGVTPEPGKSRDRAEHRPADFLTAVNANLKAIRASLGFRDEDLERDIENDFIIRLRDVSSLRGIVERADVPESVKGLCVRAASIAMKRTLTQDELAQVIEAEESEAQESEAQDVDVDSEFNSATAESDADRVATVRTADAEPESEPDGDGDDLKHARLRSQNGNNEPREAA